MEMGLKLLLFNMQIFSYFLCFQYKAPALFLFGPGVPECRASVVKLLQRVNLKSPRRILVAEAVV